MRWVNPRLRVWSEYTVTIFGLFGSSRWAAFGSNPGAPCVPRACFYPHQPMEPPPRAPPSRAQGFSEDSADIILLVIVRLSLLPLIAWTAATKGKPPVTASAAVSTNASDDSNSGAAEGRGKNNKKMMKKKKRSLWRRLCCLGRGWATKKIKRETVRYGKTLFAAYYDYFFWFWEYFRRSCGRGGYVGGSSVLSTGAGATFVFWLVDFICTFLLTNHNSFSE